MSLLETIHEMNPWVIVVPLFLWFCVYIVSTFFPTAQKSPDEQAQEREEIRRKEQERIKLWKQGVERQVKALNERNTK